MGQARGRGGRGRAESSQAAGTRDLENLGPGKGMGSEFATSEGLGKRWQMSQWVGERVESLQYELSEEAGGQ